MQAGKNGSLSTNWEQRMVFVKTGVWCPVEFDKIAPFQILVGEAVAKILVVEDDLKLLATLKEWLETEKFFVETATNGVEALVLTDSAKYDLMILDRGLPALNGLEVCRRFRARGGETPVLFLTAADNLPEKAEGFEAGADDYLTKPFQFLELSMRVKALLRRPPGLLADILTGGGLILDRKRVSVTKDGVDMILSAKEFALLEFFMRHPDRLLTQEQIMENVWPRLSERSDEAMRTCLKKLRSKIDTAGSPSRIANLHGIGYRFES